VSRSLPSQASKEKNLIIPSPSQVTQHSTQQITPIRVRKKKSYISSRGGSSFVSRPFQTPTSPQPLTSFPLFPFSPTTTASFNLTFQPYYDNHDARRPITLARKGTFGFYRTRRSWELEEHKSDWDCESEAHRFLLCCFSLDWRERERVEGFPSEPDDDILVLCSSSCYRESEGVKRKEGAEDGREGSEHVMFQRKGEGPSVALLSTRKVSRTRGEHSQASCEPDGGSVVEARGREGQREGSKGRTTFDELGCFLFGGSLYLSLPVPFSQPLLNPLIAFIPTSSPVHALSILRTLATDLHRSRSFPSARHLERDLRRTRSTRLSSSYQQTDSLWTRRCWKR